jgi:hypothetical protein
MIKNQEDQTVIVLNIWLANGDPKKRRHEELSKETILKTDMIYIIFITN